jgi:hypothetical protein
MAIAVAPSATSSAAVACEAASERSAIATFAPARA